MISKNMVKDVVLMISFHTFKPLHGFANITFTNFSTVKRMKKVPQNPNRVGANFDRDKETDDDW